MKQYVTLFLFVFSFHLYSQDTTEHYLLPSKHQTFFGINFTPEFCSRMYNNTDGSQSTDETIKLFNELHVPKFGFKTGINFLIDLNKLLSLETGLHYSNQGFGVKKIDLSSPITSSPIAARGLLSAHYAEIPLKINFNISHKKTRYFLSIGATSSFLVQTKYTTIYYYQNEQKKRISQETNGDINKFSISPTFGFGADFYLNDKSRLRVEPTFKFGLIPFLNGTQFNAYLWSSGINVCYYLGK